MCALTRVAKEMNFHFQLLMSAFAENKKNAITCKILCLHFRCFFFVFQKMQNQKKYKQRQTKRKTEK